MINEPTEEQFAQWKFVEAFQARRVWLTYVIFGFNILIFALMVMVSARPSVMLSSGNDFPVLLNFGAKINALMLQQGQWFRFITPIFIHIGILHLAVNSYTLWNVGPTIEKLFGPARFFILYLITGIFGVIGSVVSDLYYKNNAIGAGASGALFGLVGVSLAVSYKYRRQLPEGFRKALGPGMIQVVAINLIYGFMSNSTGGGHRIDNSAHIFGLVSGGLLGFAVPMLVPGEEEKPQNKIFIIILCTLIVVSCFVRAFLVRPFPTR